MRLPLSAQVYKRALYKMLRRICFKKSIVNGEEILEQENYDRNCRLEFEGRVTFKAIPELKRYKEALSRQLKALEAMNKDDFCEFVGRAMQKENIQSKNGQNYWIGLAKGFISHAAVSIS